MEHRQAIICQPNYFVKVMKFVSGKTVSADKTMSADKLCLLIKCSICPAIKYFAMFDDKNMLMQIEGIFTLLLHCF